MPANIDRFNEYVATYLSKLYRAFPVADYITTDDVGISEDQMGMVAMGFVEDSDAQDRFQAAVGAAHWLLDEGYIRGQKHQLGVMLCVLTSRSFEILQRPSSLDRQKSWGEIVIDLSKGAAKDTRGATIGALVGALRGVL